MIKKREELLTWLAYLIGGWNASPGNHTGRLSQECDTSNTEVVARHLVDACRKSAKQDCKGETEAEFLPGNGETYMVKVSYISDFPRDENGVCAFCHADPCNECSEPTSDIAKYYAKSPRASTCPMCDGRPS